MEKRSRLVAWAQRRHGDAWGEDPRHRDVEALERVMRQVGLFFGPNRYFNLEVRGWENLPPPPVLIVSNHSGGTTIADVWGFGVAWHRHFGAGRPCHILGHEMIFTVGPVARVMSQLGVIRAGPDRARAVLQDMGRDLLVMPGGDLDVWRAWKDRYKVVFSGRTGYARLALQTGVPVVPMAHVGAHHTLIVLTNGARIARAIRLNEIARARIFPVHLSLPWGLGVGPLPHIPLPTVMRYRFGPPIFPRGGPVEDPSPEAIAALDQVVRANIQSMLEELARERRASSRVWRRSMLRLRRARRRA